MNIIIYGAGQEGKRALSDIGINNVLCFVDNKKRGDIAGCPIYRLSEIPVSSKEETIFLITPKRYRHEIADALYSEGYYHFCLYEHVYGGEH